VARIAEEVPVALVYGRRPHVAMMATPADLEDFAIGFTLSERIAGFHEIRAVSVERHSRGIEVSLDVEPGVLEGLDARRRSLTGRTGCGLCGVEAIDDAVRLPDVVSSPLVVAPDVLWQAAADLERSQPLNAETHAIHGAAWADADGRLRVVREDVGRHNALDKVLGALARGGIDTGSGFVVVTSRASVELVQKCAACGVPLLAAVSRPTHLAIRMAEAAGICLVGLLRGRTANVYSRLDRIRS
jgi:FdhD protein